MIPSVIGLSIRCSKKTFTSTCFFCFCTCRTLAYSANIAFFPWFSDPYNPAPFSTFCCANSGSTFCERLDTVHGSFSSAIRVSRLSFSAYVGEQILDITEQCSTRSLIEDDVDKLYKAIIDSAISGSSMEKALDQIGAKLTSVVVIQILGRLRNEEKIAFRFFMWAGSQKHYKHEHKVYNEMIDILSSTANRIRQFRIVCRVLDYMKRYHGSSVRADVLITILKNYAEKHLAHLKKIPRKKIYRLKIEPTVNAFNLLVDALCKCSLVEYAETLLQKVKNKLEPNIETYNLLFFGWCRVREPDKAIKLLEEMIKMGHKPDELAYNTVISAFCQVQMLSEATKVFDFMKIQESAASYPTSKTYAILIRAFVKNDMIDECCKLMNDMSSSGCLPDVSTYKEVIEEMCFAGKIEKAYQFIEELGNKGYPPDIVTYNCFLKVLCDVRRVDDALRLYNRMIETGCCPSVQSYNMLILMFLGMGDVDGAFEAWKEMEMRGCARDSETYCMMIEGLFDCNRIEDIRWLLNDVVRRDIRLPYRKFDSFLMKLSEAGDLRSIHFLSEHMKKFFNPAMARRSGLNEKRKGNNLRSRVR